jgi:hypothetical protein
MQTILIIDQKIEARGGVRKSKWGADGCVCKKTTQKIKAILELFST